MNTKRFNIVALTLFATFIMMQVFTVRHSNPPVIKEPLWDSPQTRAYAKRACFDCHSNETVYPWYTYVAPVSWVTNHHIVEGREKLNFSEWNRVQEEASEAAESVTEGEMPTKDYLLLHADARLSKTETDAFVARLIKTFGKKDHKESKKH